MRLQKAGETGLGRQVYFPGCVQDLAAKKLLKSSYQVLSLMEGVFSNIYFDFSFFLEVSSTLQQCQQLKQSALSSCI